MGRGGDGGEGRCMGAEIVLSFDVKDVKACECGFGVADVDKN